MILTTVQEKIYARLTGDTTLQSLLGGSGRIAHALETETPQRGSIRYWNTASTPGPIAADKAQVNQDLYHFQIFADNYNAIVERIYSLLHNQRLADMTNAGSSWGIWDWTGPDEYDEELQCGRKEVRFRFYVPVKAQAPI